MKRMLSFLLAACLAVCLAPAPVLAAAGGFTDISDPAVKQAAELLASLDVMNGVGGGRFDPEGTLDRAMLAAIGARIAGVQDVSIYTSTVRFPDVRAGHWAHGWIMAAVDKRIMVGMPDGSFQPDGKMQYQYLITVLMRLLGYEDADVGQNWPYSYLNKAAAIGLTTGMSYSPAYVPTRGETALILYNFVQLKPKDGGESYADRYGQKLSKRSGVLLLRDIGGLRYFLDEGGILNPDTIGFADTLDGQSGDFVYDENGKLLYFSPDAAYSYQTVSVKQANNGHLLLSDGTVLPVSANTRVITCGKDDQSYGLARDSIWSGESLVLAYKGALLQYIYRNDTVHRQGAEMIKTCLRFLTVGTQTLALDDGGNSYLIRDSLPREDEGKTGLLLIDEGFYAVSFTPGSDYSYQSVTIKDAKTGGLETAEGTTVALSSSVPVRTSSETQSYGAVFGSLPEGETLTVAFSTQTGLAAYLYRPNPLDAPAEGNLSKVNTILRIVGQNNTEMALTDSGAAFVLNASFDRSNTGKYGTLYIDENDNAVSFVPDAAFTYKTVVLEESAVNGLSGKDGSFTQVLASTPVWDTDATMYTRYYDAWLDMRPGETLLLACRANGALAYLYRAQNVSSTSDSITMTLTNIPEDGQNPLPALFGTVTATVVKNGCISDVNSLEPYDVLTYFPAADLVYASNLRFVGLMDAKPDFSGAQPTLRVQGVSFPIREETANIALGLPNGVRRLFLLDYQGFVSDIVSAFAAESTVLATKEGMQLADGTLLPGEVYANGINAQGLLGTINPTAVTNSFVPLHLEAATADWSVGEGKLGNLEVAPWCLVYERGGSNGTAMQICLQDIPADKVPAAKIRHVGVGPSGYVTLLLLEDVSYDCYEFGVVQSGELWFSELGASYVQNCVWVTDGAGTGTQIPYGSNLSGVQVRKVGGLAPGRSQYTGELFLGGTVNCIEYKNLDRYSFSSDGYAILEGKRIALATDMVYVDGEALPLSYARANCTSISAYTDPAGNKVRFLTGSLT